MQEGVIILGHGSRLPEANKEIEQIGQMVGKRFGRALIETCFLQFGEPGLPLAVERLVNKGIKKITVVPLLLVVGSHIAIDVPEILSQQRKLYPEVSFYLAPHLGADPRIVEIVLERIKQGSELLN
ncbi:sirohydrochlorin chelatase [Desulforamulus aquiferis]|uniref:CbiX/SirB N-terminal domain-containing protein n=1 Tax=Desulforamulus aquiferis TaxID=1397668 RepID=A0AAW7ZAJ5_9FIRM|nr:CbiX/SirB N-terminal domain-containing protein [Desulforamulus aquiferis]MDO7786352.1 CbiX/SirB N-terminal domain-containing protein [Desulforamulus aquiferis]RYD06659.1 hypothetical protein N752_03020 [Desulforamulus aquiferis]